MNYVDFTELVGKTIKNVVVSADEEEICFYTDCGKIYRMFHQQDCCESVYIEDIVGDIGNLIGQTILQAYETDSDRGALDDYEESYTWTFYHIRTIWDTITIRWYGSSNGYYSESVDFVEL